MLSSPYHECAFDLGKTTAASRPPPPTSARRTLRANWVACDPASSPRPQEEAGTSGQVRWPLCGYYGSRGYSPPPPLLPELELLLSLELPLSLLSLELLLSLWLPLSLELLLSSLPL
jgi:hypothetical protein